MEDIHMCLGSHASVLCFSTHAAWLLMSCCLISNEKQLQLLWAINYTNRNHLKICVVDFINICGYRQTRRGFFFCDVSDWTDAVSVWLNRVFIYACCSAKAIRIHYFFQKVQAPCSVSVYSFSTLISIYSMWYCSVLEWPFQRSNWHWINTKCVANF